MAIIARRITARPISARRVNGRSQSLDNAIADPWLFDFSGKMTALPLALQKMNATYTRNSEKRVVQDGALVTLAANQFGTSQDSVTGLYGYVPEPAATNLATNSDGAASTYTVSNVADGTAVPGFTNGLAFGNNSVERSATKSISVTSGAAYSISFFVIMDDGNAPVVGTANNTGDFSITLNGVIATTKLERIIGSGVYRVSASITASATASHAAGVTKYVGQSARTFRITGSQVETGLRATSYIATTGSTATRAADVLSVPLWVNNLTYSEELNNAAWSKTGCTVSDNISGTYDKIVESSGGTFHTIYLAAVTVGAVQTLSFSASSAGRTWAWCQIGTSVAYFNLGTGELGTVAGTLTASIRPDPDGGYRCTVTHQSPTTTTLIIGVASGNNGASYSGDGSSGINVGKVQLEFGSTATTYRPTTSTLESVANQNIPGFSAAGYTLFADVRMDYVVATAVTVRAITVSDGDSSDRSALGFVAPAQRIGLLTVSGGVAQHSVEFSTWNTIRRKIGYSVAANSYLTAIDGAAQTPDTSGIMPVGLSRLDIGSAYGNADFLNSFIFRAGLVPQALTQAQINGLTTL